MFCRSKCWQGALTGAAALSSQGYPASHARMYICFLLYLLLPIYCYGQNAFMTKLHIRSEISSRFAITHVTGEMENMADEISETAIQLYLPEEAIVTHLNITVDGLEYIGVVVSKRPTDPSVIIPVLNLTANRFRDAMMVYVPVTMDERGYVTFHLIYHELLRRYNDEYKHVVFLDPGHVVPDLKVHVNINESQPVRGVRGELSYDESTGTHIQFLNSNQIHIRYHPDSQYRYVSQGAPPEGDRLFVIYGLEPVKGNTDLQVKGNHFVHWMSPNGRPPLNLHALFLVDVSKGVIGWKRDYIILGLAKIMKELGESDRYEVMAFDDEARIIKLERPGIFPATMFRSGTNQRDRNLHDALKRSIRHMNMSPYGVPLIFLITGGDPEIGVKDAANILEMAREENKRDIPIYSAGIGANITLLQQLSFQHNGAAETITEHDRAPQHILDFFRRVSAPLLSDVTVTYSAEGGYVSQLTKKRFKLFNKGQEMVVAGKLGKHRHTSVPLTVKYTITGTSVEGNYEETDAFDLKNVIITPSRRRYRGRQRGATSHGNRMKQIWTYLMMKELIQRYLAAVQETTRKLIQRKALHFARQHGLWTPMFHLSLVPVHVPQSKLTEEDMVRALTVIPKNAVKHCDPRFIMPGCPPPHGPHLWQHNVPGFPGLRGGDTEARPIRKETIQQDCRSFHPLHFKKIDPDQESRIQEELYSPPSIVVPLNNGKHVCVSWNRTNTNDVILFSDNDCTVTGKVVKGRLRIIKVKKHLVSEKIQIKLTIHHITYGGRKMSWNKEFHHKDVTLHHHMFTWGSGEKIYHVHHARKSLILEQRGRSTYSSGTQGLLAFTDSWTLKMHQLCVPLHWGGLQILPTRKLRGGCHLVMQDGNIFNNHHHQRTQHIGLERL